jgi:prepilin-type N-terminal cleavage/methylation domain-containing protein
MLGDMKLSRGFTLVELLITVTIMVVLMTLATVGIRSSLVQARDSERTTEVENIARSLEQRYIKGNDAVIYLSTKGVYPGTNEFTYAFSELGWCNADPPRYNPCTATSDHVANTFLPGITPESLKSPSDSDTRSLKSTWGYDHDPAIRLTRIMGDIAAGKYVYEPIDLNGSNCYDGDCVKFNLYYQTESTDDVEPHIIKSRNQ